jgi:flavodoxin short chain
MCVLFNTDPHIDRGIPGKEKRMSKVAVVYWSGTGNTEAMANAVAEGAKASGADVSVFEAGQFSAANVSEFDAIAFGCPAMGAEVLEETEFDPMFTEVEGALSGKKTGIFGSYGWGDGQWMRDWKDRCDAAGAALVNDGVMANNAPGDSEIEECKELGAALA